MREQHEGLNFFIFFGLNSTSNYDEANYELAKHFIYYKREILQDLRPKFLTSTFSS